MTTTTIPRPDVLPSELLRRGWCQGETMRETAPGMRQYCLFGAWTDVMASYDTPEWLEVRTVLVGVTGNASQIMWNDTRGRTQAEVVAVSEEAERRLGWQ